MTCIGCGGAGRELVEVEKRPKQYEGLGIKDQGSLANCIGTRQRELRFRVDSWPTKPQGRRFMDIPVMLWGAKLEC